MTIDFIIPESIETDFYIIKTQKTTQENSNFSSMISCVTVTKVGEQDLLKFSLPNSIRNGGLQVGAAAH